MLKILPTVAANNKAATAKRKCSQPNDLPSGCVISAVLLKESLPLSQSTDHLCQSAKFPRYSNACPLLMAHQIVWLLRSGGESHRPDGDTGDGACSVVLTRAELSIDRVSRATFESDAD